MTSVLITGGAGFIGQHLARAFRDIGWTPVALDNFNPQVHLDADAARARFPGQVIDGDVTDPAVFNEIPNVDLVVHLAAETGVGQSMYEVDRYRHVNEDGTRNVTAYAERLDCPLIFFSSRAVYGQGRTTCADHGIRFGAACCDQAEPVASQETDDFAPVSIYGETKVTGEQIVAKATVPVTIVRPQNVIGPGQALHNPYTGVLAAFLSRLRENLPLQIYGDGTQTRDFVHVSDLAQLVVWLATHPMDTTPLIVNCGSGVRTTLTELATYASEAAPPDHRHPHQYVDVTRAGDIDHACADLERLDALGAPRPRITAREAVTAFITAGWDEPGAPSSAWDQALKALDERGLTS